MILFSEVEFFTFHPPGLAIFHSKKETYNFRIQKSDGEELEKFSLLQNVKFHLGGLKSVFIHEETVVGCPCSFVPLFI